jgi:hypothetical protein
MNTKKYSQLAIVLLLLAVIAPLLLTACGKSVSETTDDATITAQVKTALLNDKDIAGLRIDVDTFRACDAVRRRQDRGRTGQSDRHRAEGRWRERRQIDAADTSP